ncbi:phosphoenolpyruvate carboxykinase, partial [Klosneuvirus KNV1]
KELFEFYKQDAIAYLDRQTRLYQIDTYAGWENKIKVRLYCTSAYHALFMLDMLIPSKEKFDKPDFTIYNVGELALGQSTKKIIRKDIIDDKLKDTLVGIDFTSMEMVIYGTKYAGEMKKGILTLFMYLAPIKNQLCLHSSANVKDNNLCLFFGLSGTGKCLGKDTPVLMYDGTIKMVQDIKVGEKIMGDDSTPRNILSTCQGQEQLYEISNRKGTNYVVNESHILSLKAHPDHLNMYKTDGDIIDISVKDYLTKLPKSYTNGKDGNGLLCGYRVPVNFSEKQVDFDPYIIGYWLGDGTSAEPQITTVDKEVIQYFNKKLKDYGLELKVRMEDDITYRIIGSGEIYRQKGSNAFRNALIKYNLYNNKHIPIEYKCNSKDIRLSILAGILDSDGYYDNKGKGYDVTLKSEKLLDDIIYLARSLGYCAYKVPCKKTCTNSKNGPVTGDYFRTFISGNNLSEIPCKLQRKQAINRNQCKSVLKYSIIVTKLEVGDYYGFEIDGNKRFLLGDFTVTHNTTLSADVERKLIGDDEHVWTDDGVYNVEGGCYAKCINLKEEHEPEIFRSIKYGAVLENVIHHNYVVDYEDDSITENTRCAYPLEYIPNALIPATVHIQPKNIVLLVCDTFGLLPPVAKLSHEQAVYYFISGYTSKIPGTEVGVKIPEAVFSACFGEPFIVWSPKKYGELLKDKLEKYNPTVWLLNTGWVEGPYGVGHRVSIKNSRKMLDNIHNGQLEKEEFIEYPVFNFMVPKNCQGVESKILDPRNSVNNLDEYLNKLKDLSDKFSKNYQAKCK